MAQLNVRLDDQTRESFDALARARELSASDLIRNLIDDALGRSPGSNNPADVTPRSLTAVQRLALAHQHEILAHLTADPDDADGGWEAKYHRRMVEALNRGFTPEYEDMFRQMQSEMTQHETSLVNDILEMFSTLQRTVEGLTPEQLAAVGEHADHAFRFRGFDFNDRHEARLASYARYLVETDRWDDMAKYFDRKHEHGNSHMPYLATYQRMLRVWRPIWDDKISNYGGPNSYLFTTEELRQILVAWPYPKH